MTKTAIIRINFITITILSGRKHYITKYFLCTVSTEALNGAGIIIESNHFQVHLRDPVDNHLYSFDSGLSFKKEILAKSPS